MTRATTRAALALLALTAACADQGVSPAGPASPIGGAADGWDDQNDPAWVQRSLGLDIEYDLEALGPQMQAGQLYLATENIPWPDTYWPSTEDNVNARWRGSEHLSPAELYDAVFNGWQPTALRPSDEGYFDGLGPFAAEVHRIYGTGQCREIQGWEGICHAWTASSLSEPEPLNWVRVGDDLFTASDLKALMMIAYSHPESNFIGLRCPGDDASGFAEDSRCQDANPGAFHLVVSNMVGRYGRPLAEDRVAASQVWNQPVLGYRIHELAEVTAERAASLAAAASQHLNAEADSFLRVDMSLYYLSETSASEEPTGVEECLASIGNGDPESCGWVVRSDRYRYVLEIEGGAVTGGVWVEGSERAHPDFLWWPRQRGTIFQNIQYQNVRCMLEASRAGRPNACLEEIGARLGVPVSVGTDHAAASFDGAPAGGETCSGSSCGGEAVDVAEPAEAEEPGEPAEADSCDLLSGMLSGCPGECVMQYESCMAIMRRPESRDWALAEFCAPEYEACVGQVADATGDVTLGRLCMQDDHERVPCTNAEASGFCMSSSQCVGTPVSGLCPGSADNICCARPRGI